MVVMKEYVCVQHTQCKRSEQKHFKFSTSVQVKKPEKLNDK